MKLKPSTMFYSAIKEPSLSTMAREVSELQLMQTSQFLPAKWNSWGTPSAPTMNWELSPPSRSICTRSSQEQLSWFRKIRIYQLMCSTLIKYSIRTLLLWSSMNRIKHSWTPLRERQTQQTILETILMMRQTYLEIMLKIKETEGSEDNIRVE